MEFSNRTGRDDWRFFVTVRGRRTRMFEHQDTQTDLLEQIEDLIHEK